MDKIKKKVISLKQKKKKQISEVTRKKGGSRIRIKNREDEEDMNYKENAEVYVETKFNIQIAQCFFPSFSLSLFHLLH